MACSWIARAISRDWSRRCRRRRAGPCCPGGRSAPSSPPSRPRPGRPRAARSGTWRANAPRVDQLAGIESPALTLQSILAVTPSSRCRRQGWSSSPGPVRWQLRHRACSRPSRWPAGSARPRPRSKPATGRTPLRLPGRGEAPSPRMAFSAWKTSDPARSASENEATPTGAIMNSWKSVEFWACFPPLRMLKKGPA